MDWATTPLANDPSSFLGTSNPIPFSTSSFELSPWSSTMGMRICRRPNPRDSMIRLYNTGTLQSLGGTGSSPVRPTLNDTSLRPAVRAHETRLGTSVSCQFLQEKLAFCGVSSKVQGTRARTPGSFSQLQSRIPVEWPPLAARQSCNIRKVEVLIHSHWLMRAFRNEGSQGKPLRGHCEILGPLSLACGPELRGWPDKSQCRSSVCTEECQSHIESGCNLWDPVLDEVEEDYVG
ncbi:hypothetical protein CRG98_040817 [Punica granatum]|uniref:Uncharacterized protein n=1 Tax=Punica granatum TaxID=22663 RepID=A0A2I0I5U5_PUNGR|nr:hypothetical protein CRG98_040817 [Punica granatum]